VFHTYFNYFWLGFPHFLFPRACTALASLLVMPDASDLLSRCDLSPYLRTAIRLMIDDGQTESDVKVNTSHTLAERFISSQTPAACTLQSVNIIRISTDILWRVFRIKDRVSVSVRLQHLNLSIPDLNVKPSACVL